MREAFQFGVVGFLVLALAGCGSDGGGSGPVAPPAPTVASVTVTPAAISDLQIGDTAQLEAEVLGSDGAIMSGQTLTWSSSNQQVATVSSAGLVTATGGGSASITASVSGRTGQASVTAVPWKIADNAVVVDSTVMALLSDPTERANGIYRFQVAAGQTMPGIEAGDVLVGAQGGGFLRRVEAVSIAGDLVTANTVGGALVDVVEEGSFGVTVPMSLNTPASVAGSGGRATQWGPPVVTYMSPLVQASASGFQLTGNLCETIPGVTCPATIKELGISDGSIDFEPDLNISGSIVGGKVAAVELIGSGTLTFSGTLGIDISGALGLTEKGDLVKVTRWFLSSIGPVPVIGRVTLKLTLGIDLNVSGVAKLSAPWNASGSVELGSRWTSASGREDVFETSVSGGAEVENYEHKIAATAKLSVTPTLELILYELAGPSIGFGPFAEAKATLSDGSAGGFTCTLSKRMGLGGKFTFKFPGLQYPDPDNPDNPGSTLLPTYSADLPGVDFINEEFPCPFGDVAATVTTTGDAPDEDGYIVTVGADFKTVPTNGSVTLDGIGAGSREVTLKGVANQCTVGSNPRSVDITAGQTTNVSFLVECGETTGDLQVDLSTGGGGTDPDGFTVVVDGTQSQAVQANGSTTFAGLATGTRSVKLTGVAGNCTVEGNASQSADVMAGQTTVVSFAVNCLASDLTITTQTTGEQIDPNGYTVVVDGGEFSQGIGVNSTAAFSELQPGSHTVELTGVAPNCTVSGGNPRTIELEEGGTEVLFPVTCTVGGLVVEVSTQGDPEVSGYTVTVDGSESQSISKDGSVQFSTLSTGEHQVELANVPEKCAVLGENPRTVAVPGSITFQVDCNPLTGTIYYFRRSEEDDWQTTSIYAMNDDGTGVREVIPTVASLPEHVQQLAVSRDGTRLAYTVDVRVNNQWKKELWIAATDGSGAHRILDQESQIGLGSDSWSPDSKTLVLTLWTPGTNPIDGGLVTSIYGVFLVDAETGNRTAIPNTWGNCGGEIGWSPDGSEIALGCWSLNPVEPWQNPWSNQPDFGLLAAIAPDGSGFRAIIGGDFGWAGGAWSPDGQRIAVSSACECEYAGHIYTVESSTGIRRSVTTAADLGGQSPTWSPDGQRIAYQRSDSWIGSVTQEIFVIDADGTTPVNLTRTSTAHEMMPRWVR